MTSPAAADHALVSQVRRALAAAADPVRAPAMQAYMRSAMPFLGVARPVRDSVLRPLWRAHPPVDRSRWEATVRELYDAATHREERYAALDLLDVRAGRPWHDAELLPLLEHLVVAGAWWDLVDDVTTRHVRQVLLSHPSPTRPVVLGWAASPDRWLRRAAVLCQVNAKDRTELDLLADVVAANASDADVFLRKAVGWALRSAAASHPEWVRAYVAAHPELSALSRREALRHRDHPAAHP